MYHNARLVAIESDAEFDFLRRHYEYLYNNESKYTTATELALGVSDYSANIIYYILFYFIYYLFYAVRF